MSATAALMVRTFRVGRRKVTLTFPQPRTGEALAMAAEWSPDVPRRLTRRELREYRAGRDAAIADVARLLNLNIAVVEI